MCHRLRWTSEQLEDVNFLDLRSRLAKRLLYLQKPCHPEVIGRRCVSLSTCWLT